MLFAWYSADILDKTNVVLQESNLMWPISVTDCKESCEVVLSASKLRKHFSYIKCIANVNEIKLFSRWSHRKSKDGLMHWHTWGRKHLSQLGQEIRTLRCLDCQKKEGTNEKQTKLNSPTSRIDVRTFYPCDLSQGSYRGDYVEPAGLKWGQRFLCYTMALPTANASSYRLSLLWLYNTIGGWIHRYNCYRIRWINIDYTCGANWVVIFLLLPTQSHSWRRLR